MQTFAILAVLVEWDLMQLGTDLLISPMAPWVPSILWVMAPEDQLCQERTGINTMIAEAPLTAVAIGTGKFIEFQNGDPEDRKRDF